jgi:protein-S-isoprenylcysteine O-methyltransferase Ste14
MNAAEVHGWLVLAEVALAFAGLGVLLFVSAPYGRHGREGWGPTLPSRTGWLVMECPSILLFSGTFAMGANAAEPVPLLLAGLWLLHYVNRGAVFPFRMRTSQARMPMAVAFLGFSFNALNSWINAYWISNMGSYGTDWLADPRFLLGAALFLAAFYGNLHSDSILRKLRAPGEKGYKIPRGGLYRWVSCPNYLCELLEWCAWALATWSTAGLAFAVFTAANLAPRAWTHHRWYKEKFDDYPQSRKALLPHLF